MNFVSFAFLIFLFVVFFAYYLIPKKWQWILLLIASLVFYAWANIYYLLFLLASILFTYFSSYGMGKINLQTKEYFEKNQDISKEDKKTYNSKQAQKKKWICVAAIIANIGMLVVVKYLNFICTNVSSLMNDIGLVNAFNGLDIILPIGLSFYVFQSLGYSIDVYRGVIEPENNIFKYALFVAYFPQVLQGPIARYEQLAPQLFAQHQLDTDNVFVGFQRIVLGYFKKVAIADIVGVFVNYCFAYYTKAYSFIGLLGVIGYAIQLYADFSGFMDIAIGVSKMLGINLEENFDRPYTSKTIAEYWRRWHITLGAWFRDYLYYPLMRSKGLTKLMKGKNKKLGSLLATCISLAVVWISIGIWHGANWNYILHGMYYGMFIILGTIMEPMYKKLAEKMHINRTAKWYKCFQIVRTFIIVCFGYVLFRSPNMTVAIGYLKAMFIPLNGNIDLVDILMNTMHFSVYTLIQLIISCGLWFFINRKFKYWQMDKIQNCQTITKEWKQSALLCAVIMIIITIFSLILTKSLGGYSYGFIYYNF